MAALKYRDRKSTMINGVQSYNNVLFRSQELQKTGPHLIVYSTVSLYPSTQY